MFIVKIETQIINKKAEKNILFKLHKAFCNNVLERRGGRVVQPISINRGCFKDAKK